MSDGDGQVRESSTDKANGSGADGKTSETTVVKVPGSYLEIIIGDGYGDNPFGHASLRLVWPANNIHNIYDFGRYGKTKALWGINWDFKYIPDKAAEQLNKLAGEGILRIWQGKNAADGYMNRQRQHRSSRGYIFYLKDKEAQKVRDYFQALTASGQQHTNGRDYILDDWTPFHNCTTVTLDGAKASGKFIINKPLFSSAVIMPTHLEMEIHGTIFGRYDEKRDYPKK